MTLDPEIAAAIIEPHFDAVRDAFAEFEPAPAKRLSACASVRFIVDETVHDSARHFAKCRDDGRLILVAPEAADLDVEQLVALLCHELGHAADFLYPANFQWQRGAAASWRDPPHRLEAWSRRRAEQVEWAADSIAQLVTGRRIEYCGPCMVQCFSGGKGRPAGLR